jgi:SlyX protein
VTGTEQAARAAMQKTGILWRPATMAGMEDRIIELEVKLAYQDKLLTDLDEVVRELAKRLDTQARQLQQLEDRLTEQPEPVGPVDETPPHY